MREKVRNKKITLKKILNIDKIYIKFKEVKNFTNKKESCLIVQVYKNCSTLWKFALTSDSLSIKLIRDTNIFLSCINQGFLSKRNCPVCDELLLG